MSKINQENKGLTATFPRLTRAVGGARRLMAMERIVWAAAWQGLVAFLLVAGAAAWDMNWNWGAWARGAFFVAFGAWVLGFATWAGWFWLRGISPSDAARRLEETHGIGGDRLVSPVELIGGSKASAALVQMAASEAEELAAGLQAVRVIRRGTWWRAVVLGTLLLVGVGWATWKLPGVFSATWDRFALAWENHPPFTRVHFEVTVGTREIQVRTTGQLVASADVVWIQKNGTEIRSPMMRVSSSPGTQVFTLEIDAESDADALYIDTPAGRSDRSRAGNLHQGRSGQTASQMEAGGSTAQGAPNAGGPDRKGIGNGSGRGDGLEHDGSKGAGGTGLQTTRTAEIGDSADLVKGVGVVQEKRAPTTRSIDADPGRPSVEDVPLRYRWMAERYQERK